MSWSRRSNAVALSIAAALAVLTPAVAGAHFVPAPAGAPLFGAPWNPTPQRTAITHAAAAQSWHGNVPRPRCGRGSLPETGLQGEVPLADQQSGRSSLGYRCNLQLVGQYAGDGAAIMMASYGRCAYMATGYPYNDPQWLQKRGTVVVDATRAAHPRATTRLQTPGMLNPWEAIKANPRRGLIATGEGGSFPLAGPESPGPHIDVYDVKGDCAHPRLLASKALPDALGHEGDFAPDGRTYWQAQLRQAPDPTVVAVGLSDPRHPKELGAYVNPLGTGVHALQISDDGRRGYFMGARGPNSADGFNGLEIFDTSQVQERKPHPKIKLIGKVGWDENILTQIGRPVRIGGHPYVITTDEFGAASNPADACQAGKPPYGFVHIVDIADERHPRVVSTIRLQVNDPDNCDKTQPEQNAALSLMYSSHYCTADDPHHTTAIACTWLSSGLRIFDVRDPLHPREVAYYNSGGRPDTFRGNSPFYEVLLGTRTKDATATAVRWQRVGKEWRIWMMSSLGGVQILRFANDAYPVAGRHCFNGRARARGLAFGPARLGRRRGVQRSALGGLTRKSGGRVDRYCVAGGGTLRVAYPTRRLMSGLSARARQRIAGRAVLVLGSSTRFRASGIRPGATVKALRRKHPHGRRVEIGNRVWFAGGARKARRVYRTDGTHVLDVGLADRRLTSTRAKLRRFLRAWANL